MNNFKVVSTKYFNQYRNGTTFASNTGDFTTILKANVGEKIKLTEVIELGTIVNENKSLPLYFDSASDSLVSDYIDWTVEGLYAGSSVSIDFDNTTVTATVEGITGSSNQELILDSTASTTIAATGAFSNNQPREDVVIILTTAPTSLEYKFGIIPNSQSTNNYKSHLDGEEQAYYAKGISTSNVDMIWLGGMESTNTGSVTVKFVSTRLSYIHEFEINHIFVVPSYSPQTLTNILNDKNPSYLGRGKSLKYCNGFFFSNGKDSTKSIYEDNGKDGSVGFFNENFSGFKLNYGIEDFLITNSLGTGKLEATVANTVTFKITSDTATGFVGSEKIILYHEKLADSNDFLNKRDSFDTVFMRDQVEQTEGAAAAANGIFSAVTVTLATGKLEVSAVVTYSAAQQLLLGNNKTGLLSVNIATEDIADPELMDRANLKLTTGTYSKDEDVRGVLSNWQPSIYKPSEFNAGTAYTDFNGWDGDLVGQTFTFTTDMTTNPIITGVEFSVILDNGTTYWKVPNTIRSFPITTIETVSLYGYDFQIVSLNIANDMNLDSSLLLNKIILSSTIPTVSTTTQTWQGSIGFRVPYREWIQNLNVPTSFVDYAETNNNQNNKSSNYSGVDSYEVKTLVRVQVKTTVSGVTSFTYYECLSDVSSISDYDAGGTAGFSAVTKIYDPNGDLLTDEIEGNQQCKIVVEFTHSSGTITLANIEGYIYANTATGVEQPWMLHSDIDMTGLNNILVPSDTLLSGNTQFVEVVSSNNLITLTCYSNTNYILDSNYKFYGRIDII